MEEVTEKRKLDRRRLHDQYEAARGRLVEWAQRQVAQMPEQLDEDEAAPQVLALQLRARLHKDGELLARFVLGELARRVRDREPHGAGTMKRLAKRFGINVNTLLYCAACAEAFRGNVVLFDKWLKAGGYQKHFYHVKEVTRANVDPAVLGPEKLAEHIVRKVEKVAQEVDKLAGHEAHDTAVQLMTDAARSLRGQVLPRLLGDGPAEDDGYRPPPAQYMDFVRKLPCIACGKVPRPDEGNDPHHIEVGGWATKGSDWGLVPLCREHHRQLEDRPYSEWKAAHGVDVREAAYRVLHLWVSGRDFVFPGGIE